MVKWSDSERSTVADVWGNVNIDKIGPLALARVLTVYPWTQRYFDSFGDLSNAAAIQGNPRVAEHGKTVLKALGNAVKNLDDIKGTYSQLSELHYNKLYVDPENFRLLGDCLTIVVATAFGPAFSPAVQATWQKLLAVYFLFLANTYKPLLQIPASVHESVYSRSRKGCC